MEGTMRAMHRPPENASYERTEMCSSEAACANLRSNPKKLKENRPQETALGPLPPFQQCALDGSTKEAALEETSQAPLDNNGKASSSREGNAESTTANTVNQSSHHGQLINSDIFDSSCINQPLGNTLVRVECSSVPGDHLNRVEHIKWYRLLKIVEYV